MTQPLDVAFNAEFKKSVDRLSTEHLFANPELFMSGKVSAGDRRALFTKWVGHSYPFNCEMWYCATHFWKQGQ